MALRSLMLRKQIDTKKKELEALRAKDEEFAKREAELTSSIEEATTDEETQTVNEEIEKFETEKGEHEAAKSELESTIEGLENELRETEKETETPAEPTSAPEARSNEIPTEVRTMEVVKRFKDMNIMERTAIIEREDVKNWIGEIRAHIAEKRDLTNVGLTIPEVFLGILRQNILDYSKLYRHIGVKPVAGKGREVVQGTVTEAVWTECCGILNELDLSFNDVEVDCFKVGGYYKVCNSILEDSDIDLAAELLTALGQAIGLALDKAVLYGRNTAKNQKMPLGIVSRLVQSAVPSGYPATARPWVDLRATNIKTIPATATGIALFQQLTIVSGAAKGKYARGEKVWVMNEKTYTFLKAQAMSINAAGAIVSGLEGRMPVVGGLVEVLDFMPDDVIVGGYFELYLLAERAGQQFAQSEHALFIQDKTVFKGTARYDGQPVIAEGFVAIGLNGVTPDATMPFAPDQANATITSPTVAAETNALWEVPMASIQSGIEITNNYITGTSKWLSGSNAITNVWGEGNFIALKFSDITDDEVVSVGIMPTQGSGMQELDADKNALFKIADKATQVIKVVTKKGESTKTDIYYLGGLVTETA